MSRLPGQLFPAPAMRKAPTLRPTAKCRLAGDCITQGPTSTFKPTRHNEKHGETPSKGGGNPTLGETDDNIHWGGR